jgi:hypothetical protein
MGVRTVTAGAAGASTFLAPSAAAIVGAFIGGNPDNLHIS